MVGGGGEKEEGAIGINVFAVEFDSFEAGGGPVEFDTGAVEGGVGVGGKVEGGGGFRAVEEDGCDSACDEEGEEER